MKKRVLERKPHGVKFLRWEEAEPVCGKDFCDTCGECLHCYVSDPCKEGREHSWVEYVEASPAGGAQEDTQ